jgi:hypothetical protein
MISEVKRIVIRHELGKGTVVSDEKLMAVSPGMGPNAAPKGKVSLIFLILATAIIVFVATAAVTFVNIGFRPDFVRCWLSNFLVGWSVALATAYLVFPVVRSVTERIVATRC